MNNDNTTAQEDEDYQASIRYTIAQLCDSYSHTENVTFDRNFINALTQIVYDWITCAFAPDLLQIAQFRTNAVNAVSKSRAKQLIIQPEDVLFHSRHSDIVNQALVKLLKGEFKQAETESRKKKALKEQEAAVDQNPFGSSEEEETDNEQSKKKKVTKKKKQLSSDEEEEEDLRPVTKRPKIVLKPRENRISKRIIDEEEDDL
jgi:hypothetical protein